MQINTSSLPNALRGRNYYQIMQGSGGSGMYVWSVSAGKLPAGIWLDQTSGVLRGRARLKGVSNFTLTVHDVQNVSATASQTYVVYTHLHF
jgi:hypothetical protein